jgi:trehalose-6-phosphate synthase
VNVEDVIQQALRLSAKHRAELVAQVRESLDREETAAWAEAIDRRLQDIRGGASS